MFTLKTYTLSLVQSCLAWKYETQICTENVKRFIRLWVFKPLKRSLCNNFAQQLHKLPQVETS